MTLTRRDFVLGSLAAPLLCARRAHADALAWFGGAPAPESRVLVVVQLTGGNDGLNMAPPLEDDLYRRARPRLAVTKQRALKFHDLIGLHPDLAALKPIISRGELALITNVGYPQPDRSHFKSMEVWQTGGSGDALGGRMTGWIGRAADLLGVVTGASPAAHIGSTEQPLSVIGERAVVPSIVNAESAVVSAPAAGAETLLAELTALPRSGVLAELAQSESAAIAFSDRLRVAGQSYKSSVAYPQTQLARKLRTVAQMIEAGLPLRIAQVEIDGFDTHANQEASQNALFTELGAALAAFHEDQRARGRGERVATMVFSEFGRRVKENASGGTDHGAAGPMMLIGGGVRGGLQGRVPNLARLDDGDLIHEVDFRRVYATVLDGWVGASSKDVLGAAFEPLPLFR